MNHTDIQPVLSYVSDSRSRDNVYPSGLRNRQPIDDFEFQQNDTLPPDLLLLS